MGSTTIRISEAARATLRELAARSGEPMQTVLERAVEEYRRKRFFEQVNSAYAALREDPDDWRAEVAERAAVEGTLADGLEPE